MSFFEYFLSKTYIFLLLFPAVLFAQSKPSKSSVLDKQVTLVYRNEPLENIILDINERYNVHFSYVNELVPLSSKVYVSVKDQPLSKTLDEMFRNTFIQYYLVGDQIVLIEEKVIDSLGLNKPAGVKNSLDSVKVYPLNKQNRNRKRKIYTTYKIADFFKGSVNLGFRNTNAPYVDPRSYRDSTNADSIGMRKDSLKQSTKPKYQASDQKISSSSIPFSQAEPGNKFSLSFFLTPELSAWRMTAITSNVNVARYNNYGPSELGFTIGSTFDIALGKKILFSSGLCITVINKFYEHTDYILPSTVLSKYYKPSYSYLGIPLLLGIKVAEGKMGAILYTGYILNFFSSTTGASNNYDVFEKQTAGITPTPIPVSYRKLDIGFYFSPQLNIKLTKRVHLLFGPSLEIFTKSINELKGAPVKERPALIGWRNGIMYQF